MPETGNEGFNNPVEAEPAPQPTEPFDPEAASRQQWIDRYLSEHPNAVSDKDEAYFAAVAEDPFRTMIKRAKKGLETTFQDEKNTVLNNDSVAEREAQSMHEMIKKKMARIQNATQRAAALSSKAYREIRNQQEEISQIAQLLPEEDLRHIQKLIRQLASGYGEQIKKIYDCLDLEPEERANQSERALQSQKEGERQQIEKVLNDYKSKAQK